MPEHLLCEEGKRPHSLVYSSDQRGVSMLLSPPNLSVYTPTLLAFTTHSRKLQSFDHLALLLLDFHALCEENFWSCRKEGRAAAARC